MEYTVKVFKQDARYTAGEKLASTQTVAADTETELQAHIDFIVSNISYKKFRIDTKEKWTTVKNLMTGKDVQIDADTPWCCNPASETYWSM